MGITFFVPGRMMTPMFQKTSNLPSIESLSFTDKNSPKYENTMLVAPMILKKK